MRPGFEVLGHHVTDPSQARPGRRRARIVFDTPLVEIASDVPLRGVDAELIRSQKELVVSGSESEATMGWASSSCP